MNFFLEFDRKEVGTYVKKCLLTNHTACLPLSLFFSVGEYQDSTLFDAVQPVHSEYNAFIAGRFAQCQQISTPVRRHVWR